MGASASVASCLPDARDRSKLCFLYRDVLSPFECESTIQKMEQHNKKAWNPVLQGGTPLAGRYLSSLSDPELLSLLWNKVVAKLPTEISGRRLVGPHPEIRVSKYVDGSTPPHIDAIVTSTLRQVRHALGGAVVPPKASQSELFFSFLRKCRQCFTCTSALTFLHSLFLPAPLLSPDLRCASVLSALFYLNDNFQGGQTRFYRSSEYDPDGSDSPSDMHWDLVPTTGALWIGDQDLYHQGMEVRGVKYVAKLNILYSS